MSLKHAPDGQIKEFVSLQKTSMPQIAKLPLYHKIMLCEYVLEDFRKEYYSILGEMAQIMLVGGCFGDFESEKFLGRLEINYKERARIFQKGFLYKMSGFNEWVSVLKEKEGFLENGMFFDIWFFLKSKFFCI